MAITLPTKKSQAAKAKKLKASEKKFQDKVKRMKAQGKAKREAFLKKSGITRMTQDALHPAEMKGKPHQSQKAIKASRKKKAAQIKTAEDTKAKAKATAKPKAKRRVRPTVEQKYGDVTVVSPARQGKRRAAIRTIKASDADKERSARMVSKKAEALRQTPFESYRKGGGVEEDKYTTGSQRPAAKKRRARNRKKVGEMAEKKKQDFLKAAKKTLGKESFSSLYSSTPRQGKARDTVRKIKAKDADKERSARMVGKKAEKARAKNDPKRAAKAKSAKAQIKKRMSIPAVNLLPGGMPISLLGATAGGELKMKHGGPVKKDQGYNARLDESMGARNKTKKQQSLKSRRHESEAMEKKGGRRKYAAVKTMDKGRRTKKKPRGVGAALRGWGKAHHG